MGTRKKMKEKKSKEESRKLADRLADLSVSDWAKDRKRKESKNKVKKA